MHLPEAFMRQMEGELGAQAPAFFSTYEEEAAVGLRVSLRRGWAPPEDFAPVPWCAAGYYVPAGRRMGREPLHAAGAYYLQEPSAMAPAEALGVRPGMRVLDLCAAPGGKSTQIADKLGGEGLLVANEIHPARARILLENIERMGVPNALVCNEEPARLAARFGPWFDAVLVDAPCSGEGMFRRDPEAAAQWSAEAPARCHARQMEILESAARCLRGGGALVYSTCTFNRLENEETIAAFLAAHAEFFLEEDLALPGIPARGGQMHLYPHELRGEGHFLARLRKRGEERSEHAQLPGGAADARWEAFAAEALRDLPPLRPRAQGEWLYALPEGLPEVRGLRVLRTGVQLGRLAKGRLEPAHALALALPPECARLRRETTREEALAYLRGEVLEGEGKGWTLVTHAGLALGWGKASGGQVKNHYPKGLRWTRNPNDI